MPDTLHFTPADALDTLRQSLASDFRQWADNNEAEGVFPTESFARVHQLGLLHAAVSIPNGGLGGGVRDSNPGFYLQVMRAICQEDASAGHSYQVHNHAAMRLEQFGTPWQIEHILRPLTRGTGLLGTVGAEPGRRSNKEPMKSTASKVDGGWLVNGQKSFVTNGGYADYILTALRIDPIANGGLTDSTLTLIVDASNDGISWDDDWYRPNGMKASRSPMMTLDNVFVPDTHAMLPDPEREIEKRWWTQVHLGFACNYLGMTEGLYRWYLDYAGDRNMGEIPFNQLRAGKLWYRLQAASALFETAIASWQQRPIEEAELLSIAAKINAAETAGYVLQEVIPAAGANAQFEHQPFGRYVRNLQLHLVHMGFDRTAQMLGQAAFDLPYDPTILR